MWTNLFFHCRSREQTYELLSLLLSSKKIEVTIIIFSRRRKERHQFNCCSSTNQCIDQLLVYSEFMLFQWGQQGRHRNVAVELRCGIQANTTPKQHIELTLSWPPNSSYVSHLPCRLMTFFPMPCSEAALFFPACCEWASSAPVLEATIDNF